MEPVLAKNNGFATCFLRFIPIPRYCSRFRYFPELRGPIPRYCCRVRHSPELCGPIPRYCRRFRNFPELRGPIPRYCRRFRHFPELRGPIPRYCRRFRPPEGGGAFRKPKTQIVHHSHVVKSTLCEQLLVSSFWSAWPSVVHASLRGTISRYCRRFRQLPEASRADSSILSSFPALYGGFTGRFLDTVVVSDTYQRLRGTIPRYCRRFRHFPELRGPILRYCRRFRHFPELRRLPKAPEGSQRLPKALEGSQRLPEAPEGSRRLPKAPKGSRRLPKASEGSRRLPKAPEGSQRLPQAPEGSQRLPEAPEGYQRLPKANKGSEGYLRMDDARLFACCGPRLPKATCLWRWLACGPALALTATIPRYGRRCRCFPRWEFGVPAQR